MTIDQEEKRLGTPQSAIGEEASNLAGPSPTLIPDTLPSKKEEQGDPFEVKWDENDPLNPRTRLSTGRKWVITFIIAIASLCVTNASALYTSTYVQLTREFGVSREVATLGLSTYVFGLGTSLECGQGECSIVLGTGTDDSRAGLGPMVLSPLSEVCTVLYYTRGTHTTMPKQGIMRTPFRARADGIHYCTTVLRPQTNLHWRVLLLPHLADPLRRGAQHRHHARRSLPRRARGLGVPVRRGRHHRRHVRARGAVHAHDGVLRLAFPRVRWPLFHSTLYCVNIA